MDYKTSDLSCEKEEVEKRLLGVSDVVECEVTCIPCVELLIRAVRGLGSASEADLRKSYRTINGHIRQYGWLAVKCIVENGFMETVQLVSGESELHLMPFTLLADVICMTPPTELFDYCTDNFREKLLNTCSDDCCLLCRMHGIRCLALLIRKCPEIVQEFEMNILEFIMTIEENVAYLDHYNWDECFAPGIPEVIVKDASEVMKVSLHERIPREWNDNFLNDVRSKVVDELDSKTIVAGRNVYGTPAERVVGSLSYKYDPEAAGLINWVDEFIDTEVKTTLDTEIRIFCFTILTKIIQHEDFVVTPEVFNVIFRAIHRNQDHSVLMYALQCLCILASCNLDETVDAFIEHPSNNRFEIPELAKIEEENVQRELISFLEIVVRERNTEFPLDVIILVLSRVCVVHSSDELSKTTEMALEVLQDILTFDESHEIFMETGAFLQLREMTKNGCCSVREKAGLVMCQILKQMTNTQLVEIYRENPFIDPLVELLESEKEDVLESALMTLSALSEAAKDADSVLLESLISQLPIDRLQEISQDVESLSEYVYDFCAHLDIELD